MEALRIQYPLESSDLSLDPSLQPLRRPYVYQKPNSICGEVCVERSLLVLGDLFGPFDLMIRQRDPGGTIAAGYPLRV